MDSWKLTEYEVYLYHQGTYSRAYEKFGAHPAKGDFGNSGAAFTVWAPHVRSVRVTGDFCDWADDAFFLSPAEDDEIWQGFIPGVPQGALYKYVVETADGTLLYKTDPFTFHAELRPGTASRFCPLPAPADSKLISAIRSLDHFSRPMNIYELHAGSWKRPDDGREFYNYRELSELLVPYAVDMGYTHLELMPLCEHPFDGSWGYQATGYFAPTSRYGTPSDLVAFVDACHAAGLGVILDWVPGHFCRDAHGLGRFNGEMLYEGADHQQWGTYKFDFSRPEVRSFLLSSAMLWLDLYGFDGLRVDGVSSMLYLNYGNYDPRDKRRNASGGEEDSDAVTFLQELNRMVGTDVPGAFTVAEESSAWPLVTTPPHDGGLGFHYKWNMGWMNDTLRYMQTDFDPRRDSHKLLTFPMMYAFSENYILPLSHDEVVCGKKSLIGRMPGDYWRQFAGLRALALYQMCLPGAKLNFMGGEFGQFIEWRYYEQLEWFLLDYNTHRQHKGYVRALNHLYLSLVSLWQVDHDWGGFEWIDAGNSDQCIVSFVRKSKDRGDFTVALFNFRPEAHENFRLGVPYGGVYREVFNSDSKFYGGSGVINTGEIKAEGKPAHSHEFSVQLRIPPIGGLLLRRQSIPAAEKPLLTNSKIKRTVQTENYIPMRDIGRAK